MFNLVNYFEIYNYVSMGGAMMNKWLKLAL